MLLFVFQGVKMENNVGGVVDGLNYSHNPLSLSGLGSIYQQQCPTSASSPTVSKKMYKKGKKTLLKMIF